LRTAAAAGGRDGETHLVEDVHEGQRAGRVGTGPRDVGTAGPERAEFIPDAAIVDDKQARISREVVVVSFHTEVEERLCRGDTPAHGLHRPQLADTANQVRKMWKALLPAIQPYAADAGAP